MNRIIALVCVFVFLGCIDSPAEQASPDSLSPGNPQLSKTLTNGLQVIIQALPEAALARVGVFFAAGAVTDPDSLSGLAHFSEHLLTESSRDFPDGELVRQITLHSTYRNAYTGPAYMQFDTECLPVFLPRILELEANRFLGVTTDSVSFEREKNIVLEEMALRKRLPPRGEFLESVFRACYPGHPFSREVVGTPATLGRIGMKDFLNFQEDHIRPENAALVVKGPLDPDSTLVLIESFFGSGPERETESPELPPYPPIMASQVITDSHDHTGMMVCLAFRISLQDPIDWAFVSVLPTLMKKSGLHPSVGWVPGEAVVMLVSRSSYSRPSTNPEDHWGTLYYDFDPEQQSLRSLEYMWERITDMMDEVGEPEEFTTRLDKAIDRLLDSPRSPGRSQGLGSSLVNGNEYLAADQIREILTDSGPEDFLGFLTRWFNPDGVIVGVSHGKDSERPAAIDLADSRSTPASQGADSHLEKLTRDQIEPVLEAYRKSDLIRLNKYFLFNGTPVYRLEIPESDQWAIAGYRNLKGIKDMRPGKKPGVTRAYNLVVNYDDKQRPNPNRRTLPRTLPYGLDFHLDWNYSGLFARGPCEKVQSIIAALDQRVASRDFNTMRWYSVTQWGEAYLQNIAESKTNVARAWRWEQLLSSDHPALGCWAPEPEAFKKVNYKDLANLHKDGFQKTGNLVLLVAGGEPQAEIQQMLNSTFGEHEKWKSPEFGELPDTRITGIRGKVIPDLTRGDVRLDISFPPLETEPWSRPTTAVMVLEAALDHVLTERLREKEGLTYSAGANLYPVSGNLLWEISVTCRPGHSVDVLRVVREELERLADQGFTPDEVARAQLQLSGRTLRNLSDQESGLKQLRHYLELGEIPLKPLREIALVKTGGVNTLCWSLMDPSNFVFTATGPLFEEDLEKFDLP